MHAKAYRDPTSIPADEVAPPWEINRAVDLLRACGYVVRKPDEANIPVTAYTMKGAIPETRTMVASVRVDGNLLSVTRVIPDDLVGNLRFRQAVYAHFASSIAREIVSGIEPQINVALDRALDNSDQEEVA